MELKKLENIFGCAKHLIRNVNPKDLIKNNDFNKSMKRIVDGNSFSLFCSLTNENRIPRNGDICLGFYFPNNNIGDEIIVNIGGQNISNLTITDTNKIYMPINDKFIIPLINLAFHEVRINNALPYYIIYLILDSPYRTFSVMSDVNQLFFNNNVLNVRHGLCGLKYFEEKKDKYFENISACQYSYQMYYYSNVVKKCLRKRIENHKKFNQLISINKSLRLTGYYAYGIF